MEKENNRYIIFKFIYDKGTLVLQTSKWNNFTFSTMTRVKTYNGKFNDFVYDEGDSNENVCDGKSENSITYCGKHNGNNGKFDDFLNDPSESDTVAD